MLYKINEVPVSTLDTVETTEIVKNIENRKPVSTLDTDEITDFGSDIGDF